MTEETKAPFKTLEVNINDKVKIVNFKSVYTRKVNREYTAILWEDMRETTDEDGKRIDTPSMESIQKAKDYLAISMTDLTGPEIDELSTVDFEKIISNIRKITTPSK